MKFILLPSLLFLSAFMLTIKLDVTDCSEICRDLRDGRYRGGKSTDDWNFSGENSGSDYHKYDTRYSSEQWKKIVSKGICGGGFFLPNNSKSIGNTGNYIMGLNLKVEEEEDRDTSNPNDRNILFTFDNTFGRYGGGKEGKGGKLRSMTLFSDSGKEYFSVRKGPGFAGKAHSGLASMEAFHLYTQVKAMLIYKKYGHYNAYDGLGVYKSPRRCDGGCPNNSFCDISICRCSFGYFPFVGKCWKGEKEIKKQIIVSRRSSSFIRSKPCTSNVDCQAIDMNMVCLEASRTCECRRGMKWNQERLECQIYFHIDCSIFEKDANELFDDMESMSKDKETSNNLSMSTNDTKISTKEMTQSEQETEMVEDLNPTWICTDDPKGALNAGYDPNYFERISSGKFGKELKSLSQQDLLSINGSSECPDKKSPLFSLNRETGEYFDCKLSFTYKMFCPRKCNACKEKWDAELKGLDVGGISIPSYTLTEYANGALHLDLNDLSPSETLSTSNLIKLDLAETKAIEIKKEFCLEMKAISMKYSEPTRILNLPEEVG